MVRHLGAEDSVSQIIRARLRSSRDTVPRDLLSQLLSALLAEPRWSVDA